MCFKQQSTELQSSLLFVISSQILEGFFSVQFDLFVLFLCVMFLQASLHGYGENTADEFLLSEK